MRTTESLVVPVVRNVTFQPAGSGFTIGAIDCYCLCDHQTPYKGRIRSAIEKGSTAMPVVVRRLDSEDKDKRKRK